jgi:hypothetical protein
VTLLQSLLDMLCAASAWLNKATHIKTAKHWIMVISRQADRRVADRNARPLRSAIKPVAP